MSDTNEFRVGLTSDFLAPDGSPVFGDIGLDSLNEQTNLTVDVMPNYGAELPRTVAADYDAILVLSPSVTFETLGDGCRLSLIARFGVGYDNVDVKACSANDVMLTITPDGVRRPVAVSALTLVLALAHRLQAKDRLTRHGGWNQKLDHMGIGLTGRTLGLVGFGNIGREIARVFAPLEMRLIASDPYATAESAVECGVELLDLETLLSESDFVVLCCALTDSTRHLLNDRRLALMKETAFLINIARGPVVDQQALTAILQEKRIAGAALDVFEHEPIANNDPLLSMDNVLLTPHAVCWTDELFRGSAESACRAIRDTAAGQIPENVVNQKVVTSEKLQAKLSRFRD